MSANTWTTPDQRDFLSERWPEYWQIHASGGARYEDFWARLMQDWFTTFPELKILFPDVDNENILTPEERIKLSSAVKARVNVSFILS